MKVYTQWLIIIFLFTSCSTYIDDWHAKLDEESKALETERPIKDDKFGIYRNKNLPVMNNPKNLPQTSGQTKFLEPPTKRKYQSLDSARRRYSVNDLQDNDENASLWSANGKTTYLFSGTKKRGNGDIITVYVQKNLRDEITLELQKATPELAMLGNKLDKENKEKDATKNEKEKSSGSDNNKEAGEPEIYDRISSVIVEEITQDHLLLKGQKQILFNGRKKTVELQALVNRRDIKSDDTIESSAFLENAIVVTR